MKLDWILTADSATARIYSVPASKYKSELTFLKELNHAEGKMKPQDLVTDRPGAYNPGHAQPSSANAVKGFSIGHYVTRDPKEVEIDKFIKEIAKMLEHAHSTHQYEKLILVAAPHILGLLNKNLSKEVKKIIKHSIIKDGIHISDTALHNLIQEELIPYLTEG